MSNCYCDFDPPEFYSTTTPRANKQHTCSECGSPISPGEKYERAVGNWCGGIDVFKTCPDCLEIRDALSEMDCFCWTHGGLYEDVLTQFGEAQFSPGLRFAYMRILATHKVFKNRRPAK